QWRGGVWIDPNGACWLVIAGLAKGGHEDREDFYKRLKRLEENGRLDSLLPADDDLRLWRLERASKLLYDWDLQLQRKIANVLRSIGDDGQTGIRVLHPMPQSDQDVLLAAIDFEIEPVREANYEADEIFVEFRPGARWQGSDILWHLKARILLSLHPSEQDWDAYKETFSNIAEP